MPYLNRTIYMPMELLQAFSQHTGLFWNSIEIEGAICDAIAAAMQPQAAQPHDLPVECANGCDNGYQWKQVFLPEGTVLRASFDHQPYYAVVQGSEIRYGQYSLSPSAFANLQGSGNRNAWKAVWLRFPGYLDWVRADACRGVRQALTARLFEANQPERSQVPDAQQHYIDKRPTKNDAVPMFQLLRDFPEDAELAASPPNPIPSAARVSSPP